MSKVLCFGELLLRMSPAVDGGWLKEAAMPVYLGGAELNVATALARWKVDTAYCTALPANDLAKEIVAELQARNIDTSPVQFSGERIGIYFLPSGADLKHNAVIYDRSHSAFAGLRAGSIDWDKVLHNVSWFHFSAISPALNENVAALCLEGLQAAKQKNITISVDLNYRPKLWQYGKKPVEIMPALMHYCEVVMGNIWSASAMLGLPLNLPEKTVISKETYLQCALSSATAIQQKFTACKMVANTFRFEEGDGGVRYYGTLFSSGRQYESFELKTDEIQDKVGTGDCFMAGLIRGTMLQHNLQDTVNFSAAAAFGKLQETGDATQQDVETIIKRLERYG